MKRSLKFLITLVVLCLALCAFFACGDSNAPASSETSAESQTGTSTDTQPAGTQPAETQPAETQPAGTQPAETQPAGTQPAETQPAETQPAETQPAETQPAETQPAETTPEATEPEGTDPVTPPSNTEPAKKTVATLENIQDLSKSYDKAELANPTFTTNSNGAVTFEWYQGATKLDAKPVNAGTYKVKVIIAETETYTAVSAEKEFTIGKAQGTLTGVAMSSVEISYGESYNVNYTIGTEEGDVTIEYKAKNAEDNTYTTLAPVNAGTYTARVTLGETDNYYGKFENIDFEIKVCSISGVNTSVTYNGEEEYEIDLSESYPDVKLKAIFESKNVGAMLVDIEVLENNDVTSNYVVEADTCLIEIVAKEVGIVWTAPASLRFDGGEKTPTATLLGVLAGDDCAPQILRKDGDNVWFDSTFTFEAMSLDGADAGNYKLSESGTLVSPEYTIIIDEILVGDDGEYVADGEYYHKIVIETEGYYYFDYISSNQGMEILFTLYAKESDASIFEFEVGDEDKTSTAFELEAGIYYVKSFTDDEPQYEELMIKQDDHTSTNTYGFCSHGCGTYLGEELSTNSWETVSFGNENPTKAYFRFKDTQHMVYALKYLQGDSTGLTIKCYKLNSSGEFEEIPTNGTLDPQYNDYYYLTFRYTALMGSSKTITFQMEATTGI